MFESFLLLSRREVAGDENTLHSHQLIKKNEEFYYCLQATQMEIDERLIHFVLNIFAIHVLRISSIDVQNKKLIYENKILISMNIYNTYKVLFSSKGLSNSLKNFRTC